MVVNLSIMIISLNTLPSPKFGSGREAKMADQFSIKNHDRNKAINYYATNGQIRSKLQPIVAKLSIYSKITLIVSKFSRVI